MPKILTISSGNPMMVDEMYVYEVENGTRTILADGDDNGVPYILDGQTHILLPYTNAVRVIEKKCLAINNSHSVLTTPLPPVPPVSLPPYTMRFKFSKASYDPTQVSGWKSGSVWTKVQDTDENIWDYTRESSNWDDEFNGKFISSDNFVDVTHAGDMSGVTSMTNQAYISSKVAGGVFGSGKSTQVSYVRSVCSFDTSNVTKMEGMFFKCSSMTTCPSLDTHNCTSFWSMFDGCAGLKWVNGLDFSSATSIRAIFANCNLRKLPDMSTITSSLSLCQYAFQGNAYCGEYGSPGILDAYNYLRAANPSNYTSCFINCGNSSQTDNPEGYEEYSQIPNNWKGVQ